MVGGDLKTMKFLSWSLNAPTDYYFDQYMVRGNDGWNVIDINAINSWPDSSRIFFRLFEKHADKIYAFGLHEFEVKGDGSIVDYQSGNPVLSSDGLSIQTWCKRSLQYLMETYHDVRYSIQIINFQSSGETSVDDILDQSSIQDTCIDQVYKIADLYIKNGYPIKDIEVDFERTSSRDGDEIKYRDFLIRIKNEVCIPLGLGLRVNCYAMTGDFTPSYYAWHDYKTLASGKDLRGNRAIDEFQLMTYDFSYAYSAPGPSTPLWWLEEVLNHVDESLPNDRTWIGNAGYGRRWGLDNQQPGKTVTYKDLVMWQNGMYIHNHEDVENHQWIWHKQSWLPFVGFNDKDSGYEKTFLHLYDKFSAKFAKVVDGSIDRVFYGGKDLITNYFKDQQPKFIGIQGIANQASLSGYVSVAYPSGITIDAKYLGKDVHFSAAYRANKALYVYDDNLGACVLDSSEKGEDGSVVFQFDLPSSGTYKLIALVNFNTYVNDSINAELNGSSFVIGGGNLDEWWPFFVDKYAWLEVGSFNFETSNTIICRPSKGYIWGFVICEDFDLNFIGGQVQFDANIYPFKKRGDINNGIVSKVDADIPDQFVLTGEILRRPPRPAIIFEDIFTHYENEGVSIDDDISDQPLYMHIQDHWDYGENVGSYGGSHICTDENGVYTIGFSDGNWSYKGDHVSASVGTNYSNQLILYKKFSGNIQCSADIVVSGSYPLGGIRLLADQEGNGNRGYLALLDYAQNKVVLVYENGSGGWEEIASAWMSETLVGLKGEMVTIKATVFKNKAYIDVGEVRYLDGVDLPYHVSTGAYGVFVKSGKMDVYRINISTVDRYEPLEKLTVTVDGQDYHFGEIQRKDTNGNPIDYDQYGYLIYSGIDISSTEPDSVEWDQDYQNLPLAVVDGWVGKKSIKVRLDDAGIWFTFFYIGDKEGYSVAYNSDIIGFIETAKRIYEHRCMGVGMWTMGQEDPLIFKYLPR